MPALLITNILVENRKKKLEILEHLPYSKNNPKKLYKSSTSHCRCKFGQLGPGKGQFNSPHGFCLGVEEDIIVADTNNHRIQVFEKSGEFKYQFGIPGMQIYTKNISLEFGGIIKEVCFLFDEKS